MEEDTLFTLFDIGLAGGFIIFLLGNILPHIIWKKNKKLARIITRWAVIPLDIVFIVVGIYLLVKK